MAQPFFGPLKETILNFDYMNGVNKKKNENVYKRDLYG